MTFQWIFIPESMWMHILHLTQYTHNDISMCIPRLHHLYPLELNTRICSPVVAHIKGAYKEISSVYIGYAEFK